MHNRLLALLARGEYLERRQNKNMSVLLVKFTPSLPLLPVQIETVVLLGDAFPPPSSIAQNWTQVAAPGTPGYFRTKHICGSNAKVDGRSNLEWILK